VRGQSGQSSKVVAKLAAVLEVLTAELLKIPLRQNLRGKQRYAAAPSGPPARTGTPKRAAAYRRTVSPPAVLLGPGGRRTPRQRPPQGDRGSPAQAPQRQPCSMDQLPTVKPSSVLDPCGSRTTSMSMIGPSLVNSPLIRSSRSSSVAVSAGPCLSSPASRTADSFA
jgi:hypothetical protein